MRDPKKRIEPFARKLADYWKAYIPTKGKPGRKINACRAKKSAIISVKKSKIIRRKFVERVS